MPGLVLLCTTATDLASSTSFATIATIPCWAPSSSYATKFGFCLVYHLRHDHVPGIVLLLHHSRVLGLVLLLRHSGTTRNPFNGMCFTLNLNINLRRPYIELMEKLDPPGYFCWNSPTLRLRY